MRKIIVLSLCLLMLLSVACVNSSGDEAIITNQTAAPEKTEQADGSIVVKTEVPQSAEASEDEITVGTSMPDAQPSPVPETEAPTPEPEAETPTPPATEEPTPAPATPYAPDLSLLPQQYQVHDASLTEDVLFRFDVDFDGEEETISYRLDFDDDTTYIVVGDQEVAFTESSMFDRAILIDLDPETPWVNLLVVIDWASDDYVTTEVHMEDGKLVKGVEREDVYLAEDGILRVSERTDILGTNSGSRIVHGEKLESDSEWFECRKLTKNDFTVDRKINIECGILLHSKRKIKCKIDGNAATLKKGTYLYMTRFHESRQLIEVCTEDGQIALITVDYDPDEYTYTINGYPQNKVFDNICYAD
jgi:hypothetical protein